MGIFDSIRQITAFMSAEDDGGMEKPLTATPTRERPQDDVPTEVIIHYIVKDYQRMWHTWHKYNELAALTKEQIETRAKKIAQQREGERPAEIANLQQKLAERNQSVSDYEQRISSQKETIERLRDTIKTMKENARQHESMMDLQRSQIRTLLQKLEDLESADPANDKSWHPDRWQTALEQIDKLQKQLTTVRGIVTAQALERDQMNVITNLIDDCKRQMVRIYESVTHTAPSKVRTAYKATKESK